MSLSYTQRKQLLGSSLIEVMISVLIVVVVIAGSMTYKLNVLNNSASVLKRTQVTALAADMANKIRLNRVGAIAGSYDLSTTNSVTAPSGPDCLTTTGSCSPEDLAVMDLYQWTLNFRDPSGTIDNYRPMIPLGAGRITQSGNDFEIVITWQENSFDSSGTDSPVNKVVVDKSYTLNVSI